MSAPAPTEGEAGEGRSKRLTEALTEQLTELGLSEAAAADLLALARERGQQITQSAEAERLREAFYACNEALHWIGDNYPAAMDKMPTGLFQRLQQSAAALTPPPPEERAA